MSPMCASPIRDPDRSSAVTVVPIPRSDGFAATISRNVPSARCTACPSAFSSSPEGTCVSSGRRAEITAALATSPAACPPSPSATASSRPPA